MRLSYPEVEVTRLLSSNLYKWGGTSNAQSDVRVIDTDALIAKRIEALGIQIESPENQGFVSGIQAETIEVSELLGDEDEEAALGNVIKAAENCDFQQALEEANSEAKRIIDEAQAQAEQILAQARQQIAEEREATLREAKENGYREGMEQATEEREAGQRLLQEQGEALEREYNRLVEELEPQFIDTITSIYEHIFHVELRSYREILVYLISATMRKIEGNREFLIHVSKEDYPYVGMQKKQIAAGAATNGASVEVVEDITLSKNQCLIETDNGIFDCGLGTQLSELKQKLVLLSFEK